MTCHDVLPLLYPHMHPRKKYLFRCIVPHQLQQAKAVVCDSQWAKKDATECFDVPPLEAMACGCSVVTSSVASLPEVCGDAAYYVDPYDMDSIAEGIYNILVDETL